MIDPLRLSRQVEARVTRGLDRMYWRFRVDRWYGGVATADASGCNLRCVFCWSWSHVTRPRGFFISPEEVAERLSSAALSAGVRRVRVSGGEPTIGRAHLLRLIELLEGSGLLFILETNGILIGADRSYAEDLSGFSHLHVRVSLKGCSPEEFSRLTGAVPEAFRLQLASLENLARSGASFHPSVVISFSTEDSLRGLVSRLREIDPSLPAALALEEVILYPPVRERLRRAGLLPEGP
ncbi:MAG: molybdenum cofactor biosynthesis protein MoaA [Thermoproteota archaeon]|nr:MAG: molybdenum cofactor biosynthesis protein MoaA [Candidatus Korarchaeota archaeon]